METTDEKDLAPGRHRHPDLATWRDAQDITEFRIGILGGENAQDRLNSTSACRRHQTEVLGVPKPSCSRPPTITA
jgi:ABC-type phosphate/phosphonate transport system substrate-binding protein